MFCAQISCGSSIEVSVQSYAHHHSKDRLLPQHAKYMNPYGLGFSLESGLRHFLRCKAGESDQSQSREMRDGSMDAEEAPRFMTVVEVAEVMRVSKMTVYRLIHAGELPAIRVGKSFRVPYEAVSALIEGSWSSDNQASANG